jgi:alpha-tubulin suppressor-like RCC1 family protein/formylglycine-generating enzyme required for sulfatase activity
MTTPTPTPTSPPPATYLARVWGLNIHGQLARAGEKLTLFAATPVGLAVPTGDSLTGGYMAVSTNWHHTLVIRTNRQLFSCGAGADGQLGRGEGNTRTDIFEQITLDGNNAANDDWASVTAGLNCSFAIKTNGTLWGWGLNSNFQLTDTVPANQSVFTPRQLDSGTNWAEVIYSPTGTEVFALKTDGTLWSWGLSSLYPGVIYTRPTRVGSATYKKIAASNHVVAIRTDGTLWGWGNNINNQLGIVTQGQTTAYGVIRQLNADNNWLDVAVGPATTLALKTNGTLWGCGLNTACNLFGYTTQPGNATLILPTFTQLGTQTWHSIAIGNNFAVGVNTVNRVPWTWGCSRDDLGRSASIPTNPAQISSSAVNTVSVSASTSVFTLYSQTAIAPTPIATPAPTPTPTAPPVSRPLQNAITFKNIYDLNNRKSAKANNTNTGSVGYAYKISATEISVAQYVEFLNAVGRVNDNNIYTLNMGVVGVTQLGDIGNYSYITDPALSSRPINFVSWVSAARFANWLHNGMTTDLNSTEYGAYTLTKTTTTAVPRNPDARFFIPSRDEWYKAAFYSPLLNDGRGDYYEWATGSNTKPAIATTTTPQNNAANAQLGIGDSTAVGIFGAGSSSYYGCLDMAGNLSEWTDSVIDENPVVMGTGSFTGTLTSASSPVETRVSANATRLRGFRVAGSLPAVTYTYGVDNNNVIWQINPAARTRAPIRQTGLSGFTNALAFDVTRQHMFILNNNTPNALYFYNLATNTFTFLPLTSATISLLQYDTRPAGWPGAAYYSNAIWLFFPTANSYTGPYTNRDLIKLPINYAGNIAINNAEIVATNIPTTLDNRISDLAINTNTGLLYASTSLGDIYTLNLNAPTTSFTQLKTGMPGLQVSFDATWSFVYLQSAATGQWYSHDLTTNKITALKFTTAVTPESFDGVGFRDLAGPNIQAMPNISL